jgi:fructokinase
VITVIGEALVDLVVSPDWSCRATPGGAPANVAVALARLERDVSLRARISRDGFGVMLRHHLTGNGVSPRDLVPADEPTTLAIATLHEGGQATYSFYLNETADWMWRPGELDPLFPDVTALYLGSLAMALPPGAARIESFAQRVRGTGQVVVFYDPNLRPSATPDAQAERVRVERQLGLAHVAKASAEDIEWLYPGEAVGEVARRWQRLGPDLVVVTLGSEGAFGLSRNGTELTVPPVPADVRDTIGAGDAFSAGLLDAMAGEDLLGPGGITGLLRLDRARLARLLTSAGIVAALTCERSGADPPRKAEVVERRARMAQHLRWSYGVSREAWSAWSRSGAHPCTAASGRRPSRRTGAARCSGPTCGWSRRPRSWPRSRCSPSPSPWTGPSTAGR